MRARLAAICSLSTLVLAGCGNDGEQARTAPPTVREANPTNPLALPQGVPVRSSGPGKRGDIEVIRGWTDALRAGKVAEASAFWAVPAKVQNGTPLLTLTTRADVRLFNASLACGAVLTAAGNGGTTGFTVLAMKLTDRPGGKCGSGAGQRARTAILVRDGKIVEWYRIPDDPDVPSLPAPRGDQAPDVPDGPII